MWVATVDSPAGLARTGQSSVRRSLSTTTTPRVRKNGSASAGVAAGTSPSAAANESRFINAVPATNAAAPPKVASISRRENDVLSPLTEA